MRSPAETGRLLEQEVAAYFRTHGYDARCNQVLEGRSGGRHEIDVLAEKSDALTTFRVAVECKAWQQPIEKDVVAKLHYVLGDLGLSKGIVVSLSGCTSGAERTAHDLGVELWGSDELRRHLGDRAVGELGAAASGSSATMSEGYAMVAARAPAEDAIRSSGKGRLHLRTLERLVWVSPLWLPAYCVTLTVTQPDARRFRPRLQSSSVDNLYEALDGGFLTKVPSPWEAVLVDPRLSLRPGLREAKLHGALRKALHDAGRVSSPAAVDRHAANLARHGIPTPCSSLSIDHTSLVHLPYFVGILEAEGRQRVVAVSGRTGLVSEPVSRLLTANVTQVKALPPP